MIQRSGIIENSRSDFERRLVRYALAGSAVLGVPAISHADIIYQSANIPITASSPYGLSFDGSSTDFVLLALSHSSNPFQFNAGVYASPVGATAFVGGSYPSALTLGASIDSTSPTTTNTVLSSYFKSGPAVSGFGGNWSSSGAPAYLGVMFQIGTDTHFGWAQISAIVNPGGSSGELIDYAYNTVAYDGTNTQDSSIAAGQLTTETPEPSSLALYALGAAGIMALRRRRKLDA